MTTRETLTIKKAELLAEVERITKEQVKKFVDNELAKLKANNFAIQQGHATIKCPVYLDPKNVGEELAAEGFEIKKIDKWTFIIEW